MIKKVSIIVVFCLILFWAIPSVNAESLKEAREELAKDVANLNQLLERQKTVQKEIAKFEKEIGAANSNIEKKEKEIEESKKEIERLNAEIVEKKKEIDNLLSFLQVSDGDNVYLEYIFGASSFTDFIYRSSVVDQMTNYNDELIDEMNLMIEENKQLQKDLEKEIDNLEKEITNLQKTLAKSNLSMEDMNEEQQDIEAEIKARKEEVKVYEQIYKENNCSEDKELNDCLGSKIPLSTGFYRPLASGKITSEYGMRLHPTQGVWKLHAGVDLGGVSQGTKIYAAASGYVSSIVKKSSCGGNKVYIKHNVNGKKYRTVYMHLYTINVKVGDTVTFNTVIGTVGGGGSTIKKNGGWDGCSTGTHLHFGIYEGHSGSTYLNPRNYIYFPAKGKSFSSRFY